MCESYSDVPFGRMNVKMGKIVGKVAVSNISQTREGGQFEYEFYEKVSISEEFMCSFAFHFCGGTREPCLGVATSFCMDQTI
jgi:hypothetical protein